MKTQTINEHFATELAFTSQRLSRVQAAIDALHTKHDRDILEALLVARAYLVGTQTTLEMACAITRA